MHGATCTHDDGTSYETNLAALVDLYTTLHGGQTPFSSIQTGAHPAERPALSTLFIASVIQDYSDYANWEDLASAAPWDLTDYECVQRLPKADVDEFIAAETELKSLQTLIERTADCYVSNSSDRAVAGASVSNYGGQQ